ncbi:MAG TPA: 2-dehydropantoate 2-reductase, partial [Acidimicrobiales bacterium]|nr:2-dehydropantoate 2-reductase [Acidimicrobiales bacterium]
MSVAVIGAGGIGAVIADAAGPGVLLCVRTPIDSLEIISESGPRLVPVSVVVDPAAVRAPVDVVFLTVKATDTAGAAPWLAALCSPTTLVVVVQNGLEQVARVGPYLPDQVQAVPGLAYVAAERLAAGRVQHLAGSLLQVPTWSVPTVAEAVPGLVVRGTDDMVTASWKKLLANLVANPITALTMRRIDVMTEPGIADLARDVLQEAVAVGRAAEADVSAADIERIIEGTAQYGSATGSSMLYDRLAGRPTEHQFLTGEVVRRARDMGIPTPVNAALLALLEAI